MIAVTEKLAWYVSRASGLIAWMLVAASIIWGVTLSSRLLRRRGIPAWLLDLHKYLALLAIIFTGVHLAGLVADNYVYFGWKELFIPMAVDWRPGATAWGIVAFYMLLAVQITSWLMRKMPRKYWHATHLLAYPLFVVGTVHGFQAGADRANKLVQWVALLIIEIVFGLTVFRALTYAPRKHRAQAADRAEAAVAHQ
ncbi:MAG: ferric reductase-like transmembrane domain-containing protein [Ilumatobacteraceae bacterium]